jgi:hypothetical protein
MRLHGEDGPDYYLLSASARRERKLYSILVNSCLRFPDENALRPQQTEINRTISIAIQDETPPVLPLRQVVWNIHGDNSSQSCHSTTQ